MFQAFLSDHHLAAPGFKAPKILKPGDVYFSFFSCSETHTCKHLLAQACPSRVPVSSLGCACASGRAFQSPAPFFGLAPLFVRACDPPVTFHLFLCSAQAQQECPAMSTVSAATMGPLALVMLTTGGWTAVTGALKPQTGPAMPHMGSATMATPEMVRALASKTPRGALSASSSA